MANTVYTLPQTAQGGNDPAWIRQLVTGSILAFVLISGGPVLHRMPGRRQLKPSSLRLNGNALLSLRASIVGLGKQNIRQMLGPPRALGNGHGATWYYALDDARRVAMAIRFDSDQAQSVEFFASPG